MALGNLPNWQVENGNNIGTSTSSNFTMSKASFSTITSNSPASSTTTQTFSLNSTAMKPTANSSLRIDDILVFVGLESLGTLAITGNLCLIVVLLRNKYLHRASLAIADVFHGVVTTSFFYPPIILKSIPIPGIGVRIFNIIDWTAWSITLTHMSAICLDRLIAIMLYGRYNMLLTVKRIRTFTICCWVSFFSLNCSYILFKFCCLIAPLKNNQFYTFGYGEFETIGLFIEFKQNSILEEKQSNLFGSINVFTFTYTPIELCTIAILSISNPITLLQLYRRHKRKIALRIQLPAPIEDHSEGTALKARSQWQRASTMLLEMSMRMGSKAYSSDVRELASRRANRQQQRILLQISVVAVIFYLYMTTYYLVYHIFEIDNKWVVLFNSFFYSITHMINPVIYFSLNKEMRAQLTQALSDGLDCICCTGKSTKRRGDYGEYGSTRRASFERSKTSTNKVENSFTETAPLVNSLRYNVNNNCTFTTATTAATTTTCSRSTTSNQIQTPMFNHGGSKHIIIRMKTNELSRSIRQTMSELPDYSLPEEKPVVETADISESINESENGNIVEMEELDGLDALTLALVSASSSSTLASPRRSSCGGLIQRLEEHAQSFIAAENRAMKRAIEQRNALLDALILALTKEQSKITSKNSEADLNSDAYEYVDEELEHIDQLIRVNSSTSMLLINKIKPYLREYPKSIELARLANNCSKADELGSKPTGILKGNSSPSKRHSINESGLNSIDSLIKDIRRRSSTNSNSLINMESFSSSFGDASESSNCDYLVQALWKQEQERRDGKSATKRLSVKMNAVSGSSSKNTESTEQARKTQREQKRQKLRESLLALLLEEQRQQAKNTLEKDSIATQTESHFEPNSIVMDEKNLIGDEDVVFL